MGEYVVNTKDLKAAIFDRLLKLTQAGEDVEAIMGDMKIFMDAFMEVAREKE